MNEIFNVIDKENERIHVKIGRTKEKKALDQYYNSTSTTQSQTTFVYLCIAKAGWLAASCSIRVCLEKKIQFWEFLPEYAKIYI